MKAIINYINEAIKDDLQTLWYSLLYGEKRNGPSSDLDSGRRRDKYGNMKDDPGVALSDILFTAYIVADDDYKVYMHINKPRKVGENWESDNKILISDEYDEYSSGFYKMQYADGIDKVNNKKPMVIAFRWDYDDALKHTGRIPIIETIFSMQEDKLYIVPEAGDTIGQNVAVIDLKQLDVYKRLLRLEKSRPERINHKLFPQSFRITIERY